MSVVVNFSVSDSQFPLSADVGQADDGLRLEFDRVVPLGAKQLPFLWVHGTEDEREAFERRLDTNDLLAGYTMLDAFESKWLYRLSWASLPNHLVENLVDVDAEVLSAAGTQESWEIEVRFPDPSALPDFHQNCQQHGVELDVNGIYPLKPDGGDGFGLTPSQRETLVRAYKSGFYNIPRDVTAVELASDLGISDQSLSERLRRAHGSLIESTLL